MSERKFRVEHKDGREWTREELDAAVRSYTGDEHSKYAGAIITGIGKVALMTTDYVVCYGLRLGDPEDMVVIWDG